MAEITLQTRIKAPKERVFDLSRSIELHQHTTASTGEKAVAGVTGGLLGPGEEVTWSAWHLGWRRRLTVRMVRYERPDFFEDSMVKGAFAMMRHEHHFGVDGDTVVMTDRFFFRSPFGIAGWIFDRLFLTRYLSRFLLERNEAIRNIAESGEWREYLPDAGG